MVGYSMCWDAYKSSICSGFSSFQQNGEFVDMTLAADNHFVKVHQALIAMVSPYLKALITSAPCQHPVIFLNNVSYKTLSFLLVYVYTGEVVVPSESLTPFIQTAKALHIKGLEDLNNMNVVDNSNPLEDNSLYHVSGTKRIRLPVDSDTDPIDIPAAAKKIFVKHDKKSPSHRRQEETSKISTQSSQDRVSVIDVSVEHDSDDDYSQNDNNTEVKTEHASNSQQPASSNLQYSVSIRGALQVILNRYVYNLHSTPASGLRRWRCVEYRNNKCMAFLVTKGNIVVSRANLHNHSFHDRKILQKIEKNAVFSAIDDVKEYQLKEEESNAKEVEPENRELATEY